MKPSLSTPDLQAVETFEKHRPRLMALAYRFLGSVSDAEDAVQEAYLRWCSVDRAGIENPEAFLVRVTTRLCLDQLKSARARRETYVGTWLPEPLLEGLETTTTPATAASLADDVSMALLLALERLSPLERATFLLHDVFGLDFTEVATAIQRTESATRQLAVRARQRLRDAQPRFDTDKKSSERIITAFEQAVRHGKISELAQALAPDAVCYSDSGGKVLAARRPILGRDRISRLLAGIHRRNGAPRLLRPVRINGMPGFVMLDSRNILQTLTFEIRDNELVALYIVRNPDKLAHIRKRLAIPDTG